MLAVLEEGDEENEEEEEEQGEEEGEREVMATGTEWVEVMRKHRVLAGKLEQLASGAGAGAKDSADKGLALAPGVGG